MKVAIATPFYEIKAFVPYLRSLLATLDVLRALNIEYDFLDLCGDSYVDRAKNMLVRRFKDSGFDVLLMIDSDMSWNPKAVIQILNNCEDVVGGTYRMKGNYENYAGSLYTDPDGFPIRNKDGLLAAMSLPGGFLKLTRKAVDMMYSAYEAFWYEQDGLQICPLFKTEIRKVYTGEDKVFCEQWLALGEKIWLEPNLDLHHWGPTVYEGNFDKFMRCQEGGIDHV